MAALIFMLDVNSLELYLAAFAALLLQRFEIKLVSFKAHLSCFLVKPAIWPVASVRLIDRRQQNSLS